MSQFTIQHFGSHSLADFPEYQQQRMLQYSTLSREFVLETINQHSLPLTPEIFVRFYSAIDFYCAPVLGPHLNMVRNIVVGYVITFKEQCFPGQLFYSPDPDTTLDAIVFAIYASLSIRYAWMDTRLRKYPASHARRLLKVHTPSDLHKFLLSNNQTKEIVKQIIHPLLHPPVLALMAQFNQTIGLQKMISKWDSVIDRKTILGDPAFNPPRSA